MDTIVTKWGKKTIIRRVGKVAREYYLTAPTASAPNGEWWVRDLSGHFVDVPSNSRALLAAIAEEPS